MEKYIIIIVTHLKNIENLLVKDIAISVATSSDMCNTEVADFVM